MDHMALPMLEDGWGRDARELKGFRSLFRHVNDLDLGPLCIEAAAENATRCVTSFDG